MSSPEITRAARPVAGVLLVVLAVVLGFSAVLNAPGASAETGEVNCAQTIKSGSLEWGVSDFLRGLSTAEPSFEWRNADGVVKEGAVDARFRGTSTHFDEETGAWLTITDPTIDLDATGTGTLEATVAYGVAEPDADGVIAFDPDQEPIDQQTDVVVTLSAEINTEPRAVFVDDFVATWSPKFVNFLTDGDQAFPLADRLDDSVEGKASEGSFSGVLSALPEGCVDDVPDATEPPADSVRQVDNAVFRWGINNQSNALSHDPTAINFLTAGHLNVPTGERASEAAHWNAKQANVQIEKWNGKRWEPATWRGLSTDASGKRKVNMTSIFSGHNVVFRGGTGSVDLKSGDVSIQWEGTFSVIYYSGDIRVAMADPTLNIVDGVGKVTAVVGGDASGGPPGGNGGDAEATAKRVLIADLGKVNLKDETGFSAKPSYLGERVRQQTDIDASGKLAGSFPQELIDVLVGLGADPFWYSTTPTESARKAKVPLPITVSYDEADAKTPEHPPTSEPTDEPAVDNPVNNPPIQLPQDAPAPQAAADPAAAPGLPATVPESQRQLLTPADHEAVTPVASTTSQAELDRTWWLVGSLLLVAAFLLLVPSRSRV